MSSTLYYAVTGEGGEPTRIITTHKGSRRRCEELAREVVQRDGWTSDLHAITEDRNLRVLSAAQLRNLWSDDVIFQRQYDAIYSGE